MSAAITSSEVRYFDFEANFQYRAISEKLARVGRSPSKRHRPRNSQPSAHLALGQSGTITTTLHLARRREDPHPTLLTTQRRSGDLLHAVRSNKGRDSMSAPVADPNFSRLAHGRSWREQARHRFRSHHAAAATKRTSDAGVGASIAATFSASSPPTPAELRPPRATHRSQFRSRALRSIVGQPPERARTRD